MLTLFLRAVGGTLRVAGTERRPRADGDHDVIDLPANAAEADLA